MAKRARPKKPTRKSSRRARPSPSHVRGWETRRKNQRKRSRAAKKAARTRRQRFYLKRQKDTRPKGKRPPKVAPVTLPIRDFLIAMSYKGRKGKRRTIDFVASARTKEEALQQLYKENPWAKRIPWQKVSIHEGPETTSHELQRRLEPSSSRRTSKKRK